MLSAAVPAAIALFALATACGDDSSAERSSFKEGAESPTNGGDSFSQEPQNELSGDAAPPTGDQYRGSPLCHLDTNTCDPDDDGTKPGGYSKPCAFAVPPDASIVGESNGCRLTGATATPTCLEATPANADGAKCETGADCAPGFDCVIANDVGYCRRYCCSGACGAFRSQNGAETFCDVQRLQGSLVKAPVCMPIKTCKLFTDGECAVNETCSVVTDKGTTACVANGSANVNDACDEEHCSAGLTCLGQAGSRKCFQLCKTKNGPSCGPNQFCKPSTIFPDPTVGVCAPVQ